MTLKIAIFEFEDYRKNLESGIRAGGRRHRSRQKNPMAELWPREKKNEVVPTYRIKNTLTFYHPDFTVGPGVSPDPENRD